MQNKENTFKILSIDGGGIKGLYSATILKEFEKHFKCNISDQFDMICGTSTGGILALALSLKIPAEKICEFYIEEGKNIFPGGRYFNLCGIKLPKRFFRQIFWGGKYSDKHLIKALKKVFGTKIIGDSNNLLCIPSYTITEARPFVFKYDHSEGNLDRDNEVKMVDVALATSSAPTFFPLAEIEDYDNKQFIDGGVWANNPTLVGLLEALDYFVGVGKNFDNLKIMSISSLSVKGGKPTGLKRQRSFFRWKNDLFETSMNGQSLFIDFFMSKISETSSIDINYIRIPSIEISSEQIDYIQLDIATKEALDMIKGKGKDQANIYKKKEEVEIFFQEKKQYKTR